MKSLAVVACLIAIGISVSACSTFNDDKPPFGRSPGDDVNQPPYGQSSGQKSGGR